MSVAHHGWNRHLREIGMVVLGLILAAIPLALWVAWSEYVLFLVLAAALLAAAAFVALARLGPADAEVHPSGVGRVSVSEEFIAELHSLTPLTYHHRRLGDPRLRRKFAKLRALMRRAAG